jgi:hypothetical protein
MHEWEFLGEEHADIVRAAVRRKPSGRKWRLFAVACCHRVRSHFVWHWELVELAEELAHGRGSVHKAARELAGLSEADIWIDDTHTAFDVAHVEEWNLLWPGTGNEVLSAVPDTRPDNYSWFTAAGVARQCSYLLLDNALRCTELVDDPPESLAERQAQYPLFRDIFGNPFRPVAFDPAWRTDTTVAVARQVYESREFGAMPILADALQDAGCENQTILNHCRDANQPHVRGCWVVDLVLGKE